MNTNGKPILNIIDEGLFNVACKLPFVIASMARHWLYFFRHNLFLPVEVAKIGTKRAYRHKNFVKAYFNFKYLIAVGFIAALKRIVTSVSLFLPIASTIVSLASRFGIRLNLDILSL